MDAESGQGLGSRPGRGPEGALGAGLARRRAGRGAPGRFPLVVNASTSGHAGLLPRTVVAVRKGFPEEVARRRPEISWGVWPLGRCSKSGASRSQRAGTLVFYNNAPPAFMPGSAGRNLTQPAGPRVVVGGRCVHVAFHRMYKGSAEAGPLACRFPVWLLF